LETGDPTRCGIAVFRPKPLRPFFCNRIALDSKVDFPWIDGRILNVDNMSYEIHVS
jgi:hypothetical protein